MSPRRSAHKPERGKYDKTFSKPPRDLAIEALGHLSNAKASDRGHWLKVGAALKHTNPDLLPEWETFSKRGGDKYIEGECAKQWKTFGKNGKKPVTVWTIVKMAMDDSGGRWPPEDKDDGKKPNPPAPPPRRPTMPPPTRPAPSAADLQYKAIIAAAQTSVEKTVGARWPLVHTAVYPGDFHMLRFREEGNDKKETRPIHRNGQGWKIGDPPGLLPLYHANDLAAADFILWLEGEPKTDAARALGFVATTTSHGAQSPHRTDVSLAAGKEILILNDNDDDGRGYAQEIAVMLTSLTPPARVRILELPGLPEHGDIVEFIETRDSAESDDIRAEIMALAEGVPYFQPPPEEKPGIQFVTLDQVTAKELTWMIQGKIPLGNLSLLAGDPGLGKSFTTIDWIRCVTRGAPAPDGSPVELGSAIILAAEDDPATTILPRAKAAGCDLTRIACIRGVKRVGEDGEGFFDLSRDVDQFDDVLAVLPDVRVLIIDPIDSYLGETDSHKNSEVRGVLAKLQMWAAARNIAVIIVKHLNKSASTNALHRMTGSIAFAAAARCAWLVTRDADDDDRRLLTCKKMNLAPEPKGWAFRLVPSIDDPSVARVEWEAGEIDMSADEALAGEGGSKTEDAIDWLRGQFANGKPVLATAIRKACPKDIKPGTLRRAQDRLKIVAEKDRTTPNGAWYWSLPNA